MQVAHLSKHYKLGSGPFSPKREFRAVDDVSFTLRRGEIVGESGSGKSSIARMLTGPRLVRHSEALSARRHGARPTSAGGYRRGSD
ncbi:ATP-binding cassette domain-containing protein, partial [Sinorhizobium meliloti]